MTREQKGDLLRRQRETREDDTLSEAAERLLRRIRGEES